MAALTSDLTPQDQKHICLPDISQYFILEGGEGIKSGSIHDFSMDNVADEQIYQGKKQKPISN